MATIMNIPSHKLRKLLDDPNFVLALNNHKDAFISRLQREFGIFLPLNTSAKDLKDIYIREYKMSLNKYIYLIQTQLPRPDETIILVYTHRNAPFKTRREMSGIVFYPDVYIWQVNRGEYRLYNTRDNGNQSLTTVNTWKIYQTYSWSEIYKYLRNMLEDSVVIAGSNLPNLLFNYTPDFLFNDSFTEDINSP